MTSNIDVLNEILDAGYYAPILWDKANVKHAIACTKERAKRLPEISLCGSVAVLRMNWESHLREALAIRWKECSAERRPLFIWFLQMHGYPVTKKSSIQEVLDLLASTPLNDLGIKNLDAYYTFLHAFSNLVNILVRNPRDPSKPTVSRFLESYRAEYVNVKKLQELGDLLSLGGTKQLEQFVKDNGGFVPDVVKRQRKNLHKLTGHLADDYPAERIQNIKDSLKRINKLMAEIRGANK